MEQATAQNSNQRGYQTAGHRSYSLVCFLLYYSDELLYCRRNSYDDIYSIQATRSVLPLVVDGF
jgi:hypothetical protein